MKCLLLLLTLSLAIVCTSGVIEPRLLSLSQVKSPQSVRSYDDLSFDLLFDDQRETNGCEDHDKGSECCTVLNIPLIKDHPKICINITLEEGGKMAFYLTWDSKVLVHGSIINFNEPYCAKVPIPGIGNLVELCVLFKDVEQVGNRQKGCAYLKLRIFAPVFEVKLGCFDFKV